MSGEYIVLYQIILFHKQTKGDLRNLQILFYRLASHLRKLFYKVHEVFALLFFLFDYIITYTAASKWLQKDRLQKQRAEYELQENDSVNELSSCAFL